MPSKEDIQKDIVLVRFRALMNDAGYDNFSEMERKGEEILDGESLSRQRVQNALENLNPTLLTMKNMAKVLGVPINRIFEVFSDEPVSHNENMDYKQTIHSKETDDLHRFWRAIGYASLKKHRLKKRMERGIYYKR